jgi:hypothetical protein
MELTKEQALQNCADMWDWMAKHKVRRKYEAPGTIGVLHNCWCCEYTKKIPKGCSLFIADCDRCPMKSYWIKTTQIRHRECSYFCEAEGTSYTKWRRANSYAERAYYAKLIANAARRELAKLMKESRMEQVNN